MTAKTIPPPGRIPRRGGSLLRAWAIVSIVLLCAPFAAADNVFKDPNCDLGRCVEPTVCWQGVDTDVGHAPGYCQANTCDPALWCDGAVARNETCGYNETVEGHTCLTTYGALFGMDRPVTILGTSADIPLASGHASLLLTEGNATLRDLPNAWTSDSVSVGLVVLGFDTGTTEVGVYRSTIDLGGGQSFNDVGVTAAHSGPAGASIASASVYFVDFTPVGCTVSTNAPVGGSTDCPAIPWLA